MSSPFDPVIVGFLCNWCSYRAADLVGMARRSYSPNMVSVRTMCTSRVDPEFVLKAFREGADGVLIFGCHPGECHYVDGNIKTLRRMVLLRQMLEQFGIEKERVEVVWAAASEGNLVAEGVDRMTRVLTALGPLSRNGAASQSPSVIKPRAVGDSVADS
jgi:F420-non-reducing hydrogenase iron-sulfur subunit